MSVTEIIGSFFLMYLLPVFVNGTMIIVLRSIKQSLPLNIQHS